MAGQVDLQELQQWVIGVGRELGLSLQNADDDFFAGGGDSLDAVRLIERAEEEFGEDALPPDDLYGRSKVREIAATLSRTTSRDPA